MATISEALTIAVEHHQAGRLETAEKIYRRILEVEPNHADAWHLLGVIANQMGKHGTAVEYIDRAIRLNGAEAAFHNNLGNALKDQGKLDEAVACYRRTLELNPNHAEAHNNLGNALMDQGNMDEAVACYRRALELNPNHAEAHNNLGNALMDQANMDEAVACYHRALELKPSFAEAQFNLGTVLHEQGKLDEAVACYHRVLAVKPDFAEAYNNLGNALMDQAKLDEAVAYYRRALELKPDHVEAHNNLGLALRDQGKLVEAVACYHRALELKPDFAAARCNLGNTLKDQGKLDEAVACCRRALELKPDFVEACNNLGNALKDQGNLDEAVACYRRALELKPDYADAHTNLIFALDLMEGADHRQQQEERRRWFEQHGQRLAVPARPHENEPDPERRLRVGYVSADFRRHSAYHIFAPIMCGHDQSGFEVFCYSGVKREDDATARLRQATQAWRSTVGVSDEALAEQIRRDRIDILVDLSGHTSGNRLLVFARKPAPVQVTAWGHATGTGLKTMDYFFADPVVVPPQDRPLYAEEVIDLPFLLCYEPPEYLPEVSVLPALQGNPLTYGCVNRLEKITDRAIALWGRILEGMPGARLLVKDMAFDHAGLRQQFLHRLHGGGHIEAHRVRLLGKTPHAEHLKVYHQIDVGLDPFPQNGGISTFEAVWMGVPVVALRGATATGRISASLLSLAEMQDWVAETDEDYVRIALQAGRELERVAKLRQDLRERVKVSPFGDVQRYTRAVEAAYRMMWRRWCVK